MPKKAVDTEARTVRFAFEDDTSQTFELGKVPEPTLWLLALHGASQKIGDSYAGAAEEADPIAYAKEQVAAKIQQLYDGNWSVGGGGGVRVAVVVVAFAEVSGKSLEEAEELYEAMSEKEQKELAKTKKIVAVVTRIKAERAIAAAKRAADAAAQEDAAA